MSSNPIQTFENHARWHPVFHFFIAPVMAIHVIVMIVVAVRWFSWLADDAVLILRRVETDDQGERQ